MTVMKTCVSYTVVLNDTDFEFLELLPIVSEYLEKEFINNANV